MSIFKNHPTRLLALAQGLKTFVLSYPCQNGHSGARYVSSGRCCECDRDRYARNLAAQGKTLRIKTPKKARTVAQNKHRAELAAQRMRELLGGERLRAKKFLGFGQALLAADAIERSTRLDAMIRNGANLIRSEEQ